MLLDIGASLLFSYIAEVKESEVVDKTVAGDVVAGVLLAKMAETNDPVESLQTAVEIATKSIQDYGVDFLTKNRANKGKCL